MMVDWLTPENALFVLLGELAVVLIVLRIQRKRRTFVRIFNALPHGTVLERRR
jgi:hypothetical protein